MSAHDTAHRTTVDIRELGFEPDGAFDSHVEVTIDDDDGDGTRVEVAYEEWVWTLTFDAYGALADAPTQSAPRWLGPVIKKAEPGLRVC